MNREIKFRVYCGEPGTAKMKYNVGVHPFMIFRLSDFEICEKGEYDDNSGNFVVSPIAYNVMQFTGLKDSKGIDIYEGDILIDVEIDEEGNDISGRLPVVSCEKTGQWCVDNSYAKDGSHLVNIIEYLGEENLEVIGNIFEHPNLLTDNK